MLALNTFFKKYEVWLQVALILSAVLFLSIDITRVFVDYDEATYAQVVTNTIDTGHFLTLQFQGHNWFEKPPLYLWLAMGSAKIFGVHEFALRLPGIIASILCCLLVYLVVRELTKNQFAAAFGFLILLFSNSFYFFAKEMRLDSAMTAAILAALFFYIKGWKNEKYFFWILPCIALGFMLKSVIALLAVPIILIYSVCYWQWTYLRSKYFWWGLGLALLIVVPWHLYETVLFGSSFWNDYIGRQVVQRATSTLTGTNGIGDYAILFIPWYLPWNLVLISALITVTAINSKRDAKEAVVLKPIVAPLVAAFGIFALFTLSRTHLGPYITPAFPFFGIAIGILFDSLCKALPGYKKLMAFIAIVAIIAGAVFCYLFRYADIPPYTYDEAMVGQTYKSQDPNGAPLYIMDYRFTESFDYYGGGQVARPTDPLVIKNQLVKGPFYMAISPAGAMYFFTPPSTPRYPGLKILYVGKYFVLISSDFDLQMPDFKVN